MCYRVYTTEIKIDKEANIASISGIEIPIERIRKIEYHGPSPVAMRYVGTVVFKLWNNNDVNVATYDVTVGKKIANYINVPFEI